MEKELDPEVIKATQISLGKYVKRPPLSEKLLKKPPFRFLHDIITTVLKTTGFFDNLFDEEELISDNVKDRDNKLLFLNKVIFVITSTTGKQLSVKSSKIVSGQEPEKTNELLQSLALALDKKLSSEEAVKKYKESLKSSQTVETKINDTAKTSIKRGTESKKLTSRSSEKLITQKNENSSRSTNKSDKEKINDKSKRKDISTKVDSQSKKLQQTKSISKKSVDSKVQNNDETETQNSKKSTVPNTKDKIKKVLPNKLQSQDSNTYVEKDEEIDKLNEQRTSSNIEQGDLSHLNDSYTIGEQDLNSTSSSHDLILTVNTILEDKKSHDIDANKESALTNEDPISIEHNNSDNRNAEFTSDYQDAPQPSRQIDNQNNESETETTDTIKRLKNSANLLDTTSNTNTYNIARPQSVRPSSSRPGAPRMRDKLDNVVLDSDNLLLGKVNIIVENTHNEEDEDTSLVLMDQEINLAATSNEQQELNASSNEHGHLVQQILDSQKELSQISGKTEIEWQFGAQKAREAMNQEIEQLRFNIQGLSRVANPLGKLLDHMQEDVEVMRQELQQWTNIYDEVTKEMVKQKTLNEDSLLPLHTKLKQLERDIEEKHNKINDHKILIHKNSTRIEKLLANGEVQ